MKPLTSMQAQTRESSPRFEVNAESATQSTFSAFGPKIALLGVLFLRATLPYLKTLHNQFIYDDQPQILYNPTSEIFSIFDKFSPPPFGLTGVGPPGKRIIIGP